MRNFDTELDTHGLTRRVVASATVTVTVTERKDDGQPSVAPPSLSKTHLLVVAQDWSWEQLRDYVVEQIELHHGAFPRDAVKEAAIFKSFHSRWGDKASLIAQSAFRVHGGYWRSAPIGVGRFAKASDPYFAEVIAQNL